MRRRRPAQYFARDVPFVRREQNEVAFFDFQFVASASFSASEKNFTIGDFHSPFSILINASPFGAECLRDCGQFVCLADGKMLRNSSR